MQVNHPQKWVYFDIKDNPMTRAGKAPIDKGRSESHQTSLTPTRKYLLDTRTVEEEAVRFSTRGFKKVFEPRHFDVL